MLKNYCSVKFTLENLAGSGLGPPPVLYESDLPFLTRCHIFVGAIWIMLNRVDSTLEIPQNNQFASI